VAYGHADGPVEDDVAGVMELAVELSAGRRHDGPALSAPGGVLTWSCRDESLWLRARTAASAQRS
jgi:hypothetical protein